MTSRRRRRGFTFLETVAAVALLSIVVATVFSASDYLFRSQTRDRQKVACAELCNRLILQYLDDKDSLPAADAPMEYGSERFRWSLNESNLTVQENLNRAAAGPAGPVGRSATNRLDRMLYVTVRVWLAEDSGGTRDGTDNTPYVTMSRIVDPVGLRNPDAINRMMSTDAGMRRLMEAMLGSSGGATKALPAAPKGATK
jgi:prepilin-type N-terminal cleavage/methylation domain-containing protein